MAFSVVKLDVDLVDEIVKIESELIQKTTREKVLKTIENKNPIYFVLKNDDTVLGFVELSLIEPEAEIFDIAIKTEFQGNGYSKILMDYVIDFVKNNNVETIFLEVNNINKKAIALYEKYGFQKYSVRKKYYGENDAVLMKKTIWFLILMFNEIFKVWLFEKVYCVFAWLGS